MNATVSPNPLASASVETQRSVWNIVWSCLVTIFACVWISIHPNIPASTDSQVVVAIRRASLMLCALVAPEVIILWAMRQWYSARKIAQAHLFGGARRTFSIGESRLAIDNSRGDRGDALSKSLVILQTTWFLSQCIIRGVKGFGLTELELVTLAFAILNGVTYFFWWNKPLDIRCHVPVRINLEVGSERLSVDKPPASPMAASARQPSVSGFVISSFLRRSFVTMMKSTKRVVSSIRRSFKEKDVTVNVLAQLHYLTVAFFRIFLRIVNTINGHSPDGNLRVPTFYAADIVPSPRVFFLMSVSCAIIGTVFGAIHCIAWSFSFPSPQEQLLWRISSLVVTFAPITIVLISYYISRQVYSFPTSAGTYNRPITVVLTWPMDTTLANRSGEVPNTPMEQATDEELDFDNMSTHNSTHTIQSIATLSWKQLFRALPRILKSLRQSRQSQAATSVQESPSSSWNLLFAVLARILYRLLLLMIIAIYILARFVLIFQALLALRNPSLGALKEVEWTNYIPHL